MAKRNMELVLKVGQAVGAAGGYLSIWLLHTKKGVQSFLVERDEATLPGMTGPFRAFADALADLGRHPWHILVPLYLHKAFEYPVLKAVMNLGGESSLIRWQRKLRSEGGWWIPCKIGGRGPRNKLRAMDYYDRARFRSWEGEGKAAIADINRAIRSDPRLAIAYFARGDIKRSLGDAKGAIEDFTKGIRFNRKFAPAYVGRGNARRNLGDSKGALADFKKAINLDPKYAPAYIGMGMARTQRDIQGAIKDFNNAIKLDPQSSEAYFGRGWAHAGKGETKRAISDFTKAIKLNPKHDLAYMLRGEAHGARCDSNKAIADFTMAIELGVPNAYGNRGAEFLKKGSYKKAVADFDKAIEIEPESAVAYLGRGQAHISMGDPDKAIGDLIQAERLDDSLASLAHPLRQDCSSIIFRRWAKGYRTAARLDGYNAAKRIIDFEYGIDATMKVVKEMVRKNIELVAISMSFAQLNQAADFTPIIAKQVYDAEASRCRYIVFFFDRGDITWILVDDLKEIDLADIVSSTQLRGSVMWQLRIRHPGEKQFSRGEHARLENAIIEDLRYDFSEDELSIEFERQPGALSVDLVSITREPF
jgi:tetratricopeptide (TPR) repeat protein